MIRRVLISTVAAATVVAAAVPLLAAPGAPGTAALQEDTTETEPAAVVTQSLNLGERYSADAWELEVQNAILADSADRAAYLEVRASVAFRSLSAQPLPYDWAALTGTPGFPILRIVDAEGIVYPIDSFEAGNSLVPGSNLVSIEPYLPARWTIGFETAVHQSEELSIEAVWNGSVVATWDVYSSPQPLSGWTPPPAARLVGASETVAWGDQLALSLEDDFVIACGDPAAAPTYTTYGIETLIANDDIEPGLFPNVLFPETPAYAVWTDGSSARFSTHSLEFAAVPDDDPFAEDGEGVAANAISVEQVIIPPSATVAALLTFEVPRDARFGPATEYPQAVVLYPPDSEPLWWSVSPGIGEIMPDCDTADVKFAYGPGFEVVPVP